MSDYYGAAQSNPVVIPTQVESRINKLEMLMEDACKAMHDIEDRLTAVLRSGSTAPASNQQIQPREVLVPFAERLERQIARLEEIRGLQQDIIGRLEL